jgi:hypothetical protein
VPDITRGFQTYFTYREYPYIYPVSESESYRDKSYNDEAADNKTTDNKPVDDERADRESPRNPLKEYIHTAVQET